MPLATVLVPTHDHGPTLRFAVGSALAQTVDDLEVFIVGDGVPEPARQVAHELAAADCRVRFIDHPKGPRHGEIHRHAALREARGRIVCYLADDDLWLPDHLETMLGLLGGADFASALPLRIDPDGSVHAWRAGLGLPYFRTLLLERENRVPLSCGGHTLDLYRRIEGWATSPDDVPTDLHMWRKLLRASDGRAACSTHPTVLHFPSPDRPGWPLARRLEELERWTRRAAEPGFREWLAEAVLADLAGQAWRLESELDEAVRQRTEMDVEAKRGWAAHDAERRRAEEASHERASLRREIEAMARRVEEAEAVGAGAEAARGEVEVALAAAEAARAEAESAREEAAAEARHAADMLARVAATATWRWRERLLRIPALRAARRWAARARAR
jgi:GalNAc5-diNAcBac-PP-undecaprenol beta-1,3-glucosyltransferase